jgi:hypothetical protein
LYPYALRPPSLTEDDVPLPLVVRKSVAGVDWSKLRDFMVRDTKDLILLVYNPVKVSVSRVFK